ncbi:MAG: radical SAM protein, partial [Candidatus Fermentibacteraceae bacterium]|nr:radical SAM protein [Candidatus Fermentibacteraceae bacterium]
MDTPPLRHLYVNPAGQCNLACKHCWIAPSRTHEPFRVRERLVDEFTTEQFADLLHQAFELGLKHIKFTGGEPLLRSDFPELYRISSEYPSEELIIDIETNGTLVPDGLWSVLEKHPPGQVAVSLDSILEKEHDSFRCTPGAWIRTVSFIEELVRRDITTQVIMSINKLEVDPVLSMALFCQNKAISSLKINPIQPIGRGVNISVSQKYINELIDFADEIHTVCGRSVSFTIPQAFLPINRLSNADRCPILNLLGVLPDGAISFCGIGFSCSSLIMGSFLKNDLRDIWANSDLLRKLRTEVPARFEDICGNCIHAGKCLGECVMQNYYSYGNFTSSYWICQRADEAGIFP